MKHPPPNLGKVHAIQCDDRTVAIKLDAPVHGPITPDEMLMRAAWEIYVAAPHSKLKVLTMLKQIEAAEKQKQR